MHLYATTLMLAYHMHAQVMAGYAPSSAPRAGRAMGTPSMSSCHVAAQPRHLDPACHNVTRQRQEQLPSTMAAMADDIQYTSS